MSQIKLASLFFSLAVLSFIFFSSGEEVNNLPAAALSSLGAPETVYLGNFSIDYKNGNRLVVITGFSFLSEANLDGLSLRIGDSSTHYDYADSGHFNLDEPFDLEPNQKSVTLQVYADHIPDSLLGQTFNISKIHYHFENSSTNRFILASSVIKFNIPVSFSTPSAVTKQSSSDCTVSMATACDPSSRDELLSLVTKLKNKTPSSETDEYVTYLPSSPENWRELDNSGLARHNSYADLYEDLPDIISRKVIAIPAKFSLSDQDTSLTCQAGINSQAQRLVDLESATVALRSAISAKALLPSFPVSSDACVYAPSYAGGTFQDVFYYLPTGRCLSDVRRQYIIKIGELNKSIAEIESSLSASGYITVIESEEDDFEEKDKAKLELSNYQSWLNRCFGYVDQADDMTDQEKFLFKKDLYGEACTLAQSSYRQFDFEKDSVPWLTNTSGNIIASRNSKGRPKIEYLPGWCTGVSRLVAKLFSEGNYVGSNGNTQNLDIRRNTNGCLDIYADSFSEAANRFAADIDNKHPEGIGDSLGINETWRRLGADDLCSLVSTDFLPSVKDNYDLYNKPDSSTRDFFIPSSEEYDIYLNALDLITSGFVVNYDFIYDYFTFDNLNLSGHEVMAYQCDSNGDLLIWDSNAPEKPNTMSFAKDKDSDISRFTYRMHNLNYDLSSLPVISQAFYQPVDICQ